MRKKYKKDKNPNKNQTSFYFEDYLETNKKIRFSQKKIFYKIGYTYYFSFFLL